MDWTQVMARPDLSLADKRAAYERECKRRGTKPFDEVYRVKR